MKQLSIGVTLAAAIALLAGITKGDFNVLGLATDPTLLSIGAVGLTLALGLLVYLISFMPVIRQITRLADPYFVTNDGGDLERLPQGSR